MKTLFLLFSICVFTSCTVGHKAQFEMEQITNCGVRIVVDQKEIPSELIPLLTSSELKWPDECDGKQFHERSIEVLEIKRIRKNKKYRVRYISSNREKENSAAMIGGANYFLFLDKNEDGELQFLRWEFIIGEV